MSGSATPACLKSWGFKDRPAFWAAISTPSSKVWQLQPWLGNEVTIESRDITEILAGYTQIWSSQMAQINGCL